MSSIFSAQSCLSVLNAQIHLSEFYQNGELWGLAVYTSTNTLILIHSKLKVSCPDKPEVFVAPWHLPCNGPEIVAMAFHPLGLRLVAATSTGTLVLMRTKEDVVGSVGPGFLPPHLEIDLNPEQCGSRAITKVLWWETVDGQHMIIIGTWTAGLVVVDLRLGKAVASVAVPEPVEDLGLFWSGCCGRRLLLITGSRGSQWFLPLETKARRLWPSVRVYQQQQSGSTDESKFPRPAAILPRGIRRGASCTDRRHHQVSHQQQHQQEETSAAAAGAVGHRSSIAGWRQFSTEKLIGIKQKVADWNPLGAGRSKSFLGFAQEEDENLPEGEASGHYAVISGEDGWKGGQIPSTLEPLDIGDAGRDLGPFRLCSHYAGPAETGVKLGAFSEFVSELRLMDMDKNGSCIDSVFKVKPKFDPGRSAWTPTVVFRVSSRPEHETTPPSSANSTGSSSSYMNPALYVPSPGSTVPHHRMLPPPSALLSTSALISTSPQVTIHSCHLTRCAVDEATVGGGGAGKGQKGGGKQPGLKWFNKSTRSNSLAFSNGHVPQCGPPSPTEMPETVPDLERSSTGVTVTKVAKKPVQQDEEDREKQNNGEADASSGGIQSWNCTKKGEVVVKIYPLDSNVLAGKTEELRPADFEKGGLEEDAWMTCSILPPSDKETWVHWCLVVTNCSVTLLFVPFSLERIILKNLVCKKPATRAVEDARAIANAFASALDANGGVARVFHTAMDIFLSHNDLQSAVLMLRGAMGTTLEDVKRLLVRKCVIGAMTYLSIELGELGQPGNLHTSSNARQMLSLQHLCRIHQYLMADKETDRAKNLLAQVKRCFWEPRTEWPIVVLRGLIEARMWNMAAEYSAIHGMGRYFLEFSGYKGIELTEKPFRGSDGGDFKRTLPSLNFSSVLAFSSKWRRVHSRWFRQCLASGSFGNRDNQDATEILLEFCELFDPTRCSYRALWLQQGNEKKIEQRFYPRLMLKVGFVPRLPSQTCPIREIFVWRIARQAEGLKSRSPSPGQLALLSAGKRRDSRRRKQRPPHGAQIVENFLLALLTRQALCNASALRFRQTRFASNRRLDGLEQEEDDDDSEYEYFCDDDEDEDEMDDQKGVGTLMYKKVGMGGRKVPADAGRRQSIAVARSRFRRKMTTSIYSLVGSSSDSSTDDDSTTTGQHHHHQHHRHHHRSGHDEDQPPVPMTAAGVRDDVKRRRAVMTDDGVRDAFGRQISAGHAHAACTTGDNSVRVWGSALDGFIGLNRFDSGPCMPGVVPLFEKLKLKVVAVACGKKHTLAQTSVGVFSWGDGSFGQLGLGPNILRSADPVLIEKLIPHSVESVSAGQYHSLATTRDGKVFSFGWGIHGQLGHGTVENMHIPTMVQSLSHAGLIVRKSCGGHAHSLFLCHVPPPGSSATTFTVPLARNMYSHLYQHSNPPGGDEHQPTTIVVACGNGAFGQLGSLNIKKSLVPIVVTLPAELTTTSVVSGAGNGAVEGAPLVTLTTTSLDRVVDIDTSYFFNLALTRRGRVFRWGVSPHAMRWELNQFKPKLSALLGVRRNNGGNGTNGVQAGTQASSRHGPQRPAESKETGVAGNADQQPQQQGASGYGKLIRQETLSKLTRKKFSSIMRKNPPTASEHGPAPVDNDGAATCSWAVQKKAGPEGDPNRNATTGANGNQPHSVSVQPFGLSDLEKKQGAIFQYFSPTEVDLSLVRGNVVQVSAGLYHCLLADDLGTMYGWGRNLHGQLGLSNLTSPPIPTPADVPFSVMAVAAGAEFSLMVDHTGAVWSSGNNDCGQLGVKLPLAQPERPLQALLNPQRSSDDQQQALQNPLVGRVLSLRSNRGRVAFLRQNSVDAFTSAPKQITSLPEILPISNPPNPADNRVRKKPWFNHVDYYMDEKKLRDICESGIGRYDPFVILVQTLQLGNFLLASQICVINKCWGPACFFALHNCVPATQRTEVRWNLRARDLDPDQPVSKEERRMIRRRSTRLRLGKEAELLKTQEGMLRILFGLEDNSSYPEPGIRENDVDRIGLGCSARAPQDERTLKLWASSKEANNNGDLDGDANWEEFPEISRVTCEAALPVLKHFVDKIIAEYRKDKDKMFRELRTVAGIVVRFWVDYGLPVFGLEKLLNEKMHHMAAPIASFVLSEEDPLTCEAFINALTSSFWIRVTKAAMKSGPGVPELEDIVARMTVQGSVPVSTESEFEVDSQDLTEDGTTVSDDARYAITIEGSQLTQAVSVSEGESWTPGQTLVKVFSCGHTAKVATGSKDSGPRYSACPECIQRSQ